MRILIIRHAEPNYEIDGLTEKGKIEAELLSERLANESIEYFYCSPLGRARQTVAPTLEKTGGSVEYLTWLREFDYNEINLPYEREDNIAWDVLPEYVNTKEKIYHPNAWFKEDFIENSLVYQSYLEVTKSFDELLFKHGYARDGYNYRVMMQNHDTIALVCHFGLASVLLSHIMHTSPYTFWQNSCLAPSSVTVVNTEERVQGHASLRVSSIGDTSHLYKHGEPASFAARFCECFGDD